MEAKSFSFKVYHSNDFKFAGFVLGAEIYWWNGQEVTVRNYGNFKKDGHEIVFIFPEGSLDNCHRITKKTTGKKLYAVIDRYERKEGALNRSRNHHLFMHDVLVKLFSVRYHKHVLSNYMSFLLALSHCGDLASYVPSKKIMEFTGVEVNGHKCSMSHDLVDRILRIVCLKIAYGNHPVRMNSTPRRNLAMLMSCGKQVQELIKMKDDIYSLLAIDYVHWINRSKTERPCPLGNPFYLQGGAFCVDMYKYFKMEHEKVKSNTRHQMKLYANCNKQYTDIMVRCVY